jgi:hypothetical protein
MKRNLPIVCGLAALIASCGHGATFEDDAGPLADATDTDAPETEDAPHTGNDTAVDAPGQDADTEPDMAQDLANNDGGEHSDAGDDCPERVVCVDSFPFRHTATTQGEEGTHRRWENYSCAPDTTEGGAEVLYRIDVPADGFLTAAVYDGDGVDIDVHILSAEDPSTCLDRGHNHARADVAPGRYWIVADTWSQEGEEFAGEYRIDIGFYTPSRGPCEWENGVMERVRDGGDHLIMPATGPVVLEAHLVTQEEDPPYPSTPTDELAEHYELSQSRTGFVMYREQDWAPLEGGDFYGAGISSPTLFPVQDEAWYVNMYWTRSARPDRGARMILRQPNSPRAVVVAAGYETGPGNLANVGGTPEESHFYLGTTHRSTLILGVAVDQGLPLGPRVCTD